MNKNENKNGKYEMWVMKHTSILFFQGNVNVRFTEVSYPSFAVIPVLMCGYPLKLN